MPVSACPTRIVATAAWRPGSMRVTVKKWGNSASVRIPASVMAAAALSVDQAVEIHEDGGRIIIEPAMIDQPGVEGGRSFDQKTTRGFAEPGEVASKIGRE